MKHILDPSFRYTSSVDTDLRKTFARIKRENRQQQARHQRQVHEVVPINRGKEKA